MEKTISIEKLLERYSAEALKKISADLIEAYRNQNIRILQIYAVKIGMDTGDYQNSPGVLFRKLIFAYHPDRIRHFHERMKELYRQGDSESLKRLAVQEDERISRYKVEREEEQYAASWTEEADDSDLEDYLDGAWTGSYEEEEYGFIEAVKNMMYGNLFAEFLPKDLFYLEGELNLAEEGIEDLRGIEYCTNITELNLENNRIVHLGGIGDLVNLKALYLAHNHIEDIDDLSGLKNLRTLDLSFNDIEDARILGSLPDLEYVNLVGNRIPRGQLKKLEERCIVLT